MASKLGKIVASFSAQLTTKISVGSTTASINKNTDDDGVSLENGRYFFTVDIDNNQKEYFSCNLTTT